jgi:1-acyl-sn-glycerol-3-phosphate acyltransferase
MEDSDLRQIYDQQYLTKGSLLTYVTLILYIPLGLALLCLRLLFCLCSILVTSLSPPLKTSVHFIAMYANFMGIYINNYPQNPNNGLLIVSNHRSAFDLLVVKSIIPKCKYINEVPLNSLVRLLLTPILCDKQQQTFTNRPVDFFKNKQNYPLVVFAEQTPTNGRCLLTFDSAVFESVTNELIQPVAISLLRPWIPLCLNGSSLTVNTLASLFSPFTVYDIAFLEPQTNSERTRQTIATKLGASLSQFGHEDIRKVLAKVI